MAIRNGIEFLTPWRIIEVSSESKNRGERFSDELKSEVPPNHLLYGLKARTVATLIDRDDVLFEIEGGQMHLAGVYMTWRKETDADGHAKLFLSWEGWVWNEMLPAVASISCDDTIKM